MSINALRKALQTGTPAALEALMDDESVVFWVDWREEDDWHSLESQFGNKVQQHFMAIAEEPNLFTDPVRPPTDGSRKWWQFWK